jgi:hypothetical protein
MTTTMALMMIDDDDDDEIKSIAKTTMMEWI